MNGLHQGQPVYAAGAPLEQAQAAMILIHGRGADAPDILGLAEAFNQPAFAYLAPQAAGFTWYPNRFIAPLASNEPYLSSALAVVGDVLAHIEQAGIAPEKTVLLGFSQGACLALEYAARHARRYGGVVALSGGLIGPPGTVFEYPGSLDQTPVFLGCSDVDFHIPLERVQESTAALRRLGGNVTERIYPNMGHTINQDEIDFVRDLLVTIVKS
jgi:predicted esterase